MKRTYLFLTALLCTSISAPAYACRCVPDSQAGQKLLNDSSIAIARVYVRGTNPAIGQSMLELKETLHGGLFAQNFRAKFATHSCGVVPTPKTEQTLVIKFEKDGTYSVLNDCERQNTLNAFNKGN